MPNVFSIALAMSLSNAPLARTTIVLPLPRLLLTPSMLRAHRVADPPPRSAGSRPATAMQRMLISSTLSFT